MELDTLLNRQNPIVKCEKLIFIRLYLGKK